MAVRRCAKLSCGFNPVHMYLMKVKGPAAAKIAWGYYGLDRRIPASELFSVEPSPDCAEPAR